MRLIRFDHKTSLFYLLYVYSGVKFPPLSLGDNANRLKTFLFTKVIKSSVITLSQQTSCPPWKSHCSVRFTLIFLPPLLGSVLCRNSKAKDGTWLAYFPIVSPLRLLTQLLGPFDFGVGSKQEN